MSNPLRKPIPGFTGYYAHYDGLIESCRFGRSKFLKPDLRKPDNRKRYTLRRDDGAYIRRYGSYFVLLAWAGPRPFPDWEACHGDGNCQNDSVDNLRWGTKADNTDDKFRHGTQVNGEQIHTCKITPEQVREIRLKRETGFSLREISQQYGITEANVSYIALRKSWKHLT